MIHTLKQKIWPSLSPAFLVAGAQKAGTTTLFHYLIQHPQIVAPRKKEIDYFWLDHYYEKGEHWYLDHFPAAFSHKNKITFEATPHYLFSKKAAERIYKFNKNIKIILLLRDPVERAFSQFQMYQRKRKDKSALDISGEKYGGELQVFFEQLKSPDFFRDFDEAIQREWAAIQKGEMLAPYLIAQGFYYQQIDNYLKYFPKEQIRIVYNKNLKSKPEETLNDIMQFLKLKKINWKNFDLKKYNEGKYEETISTEIRKLLENIYEKYNTRY